MMKGHFAFALMGAVATADQLVWEDNFDTFDMRTWKHEITMGGGGNWEF